LEELQLPVVNSLTLSFCRAMLAVLMLGAIVPLAAQKISPRKQFDSSALRAKLSAAVSNDLEIVKDEIRERWSASGGSTYWLVHVKAKHSGDFTFTYRYKSVYPQYSHVERAFNLRLGPKGCRRGPPFTGSYSRFCVGDTIILPILVNNFTEHEFKLKSSHYTKEDDAVFEQEQPRPSWEGLDRSPVSNSVRELRYVGRTSVKLPHSDGGYTLEAYATFVAEHPGRFNIAVSRQIKKMPADLSNPWDALTSFPIIIVPSGTPVTLLASRHEVRGYSRGYDGREWVSSTSGDAYMTDVMILQPGDYITLEYYTSVRGPGFERQQLELAQNEIWRPEAPPPQIVKLPFSPYKEHDFTEWLVDYLRR
jgi:hypothetical protein